MTILSSDTKTLSHEAYIYLYPLVIMEVTRSQAVNTPAGTQPGRGPANTFAHVREFPAADFRSVVRPNFDTLYSLAWLDLTAGPQVLHAPDTDDRYYMLPMMDMWTDVFANPGKRTTGTNATDFLVVGPGWVGETPEGMTLITSPTPHVWLVGRTQTNGPADYDAVHAIQDGYTLRPLDPTSATSTAVGSNVDVTVEPPRLVNAMSAVEFFSFASQVLAQTPPHATDFDKLARIANIGIVAGAEFDPSRFEAAELAELEAGVAEARTELVSMSPGLGVHSNGWMSMVDTMGVYGNSYLKRAVVARAGLGANPAEDAVYPLLLADVDGEPLRGESDYVLRFESGQTPPVFAFWSLTMYDAEGYQVCNELNRFALGDRDPLRYGDDGSLELYIQQENPGPDREANWLPAPNGQLGITMRLYGPKPEVLSGAWVPPAVTKR